jgi:hypothetical protein
MSAVNEGEKPCAGAMMRTWSPALSLGGNMLEIFVKIIRSLGRGNVLKKFFEKAELMFQFTPSACLFFRFYFR